MFQAISIEQNKSQKNKYIHRYYILFMESNNEK